MIRRPMHESSGPRYSTLPQDRELRIAPGTIVIGGRFEIVEELARGGMAVVYRALDHYEGGEVAIKVVTVAADRIETEARFRNEARLGASLAGHPHVVHPLAVGHLDGPQGFVGRMYLVTELVPGVSADVVMEEHGTGLPLRRACRIARDVARALVDLHERGIVHRDIKPGNVLLSGSGDEEHARLLDFGLAYATGDGWETKSPDLTADGHAPGTPLYMSPQQVGHERPTPELDIYSFGVMLYELFSGDPPYEGYALGDLLARKCDPKGAPFPIAKMCPELPSRLADLVDRCMRYQPTERPSAVELLGVLEAAVANPRLGHPPRPMRRWLLLAAASVAVAAGLAALYWWPTGAVEPREPIAVGQPALPSTATYAKTEPDLGSPDVGGGMAVEPAVEAEGPEAAPPESPQPSAPKANPKKVKAPRINPEAMTEPEVELDHCPEEIRSAHDAARSRQWSRVLKLTKRTKCWTPSAMDDRTRLRTQALFEVNRYRECAELGRGSSDRSVARWVATCEAHLTKDETP